MEDSEESGKKLVTKLIKFIRSNYSPEEKVKEEKNGGRTIFFRKAGKSLCYVETGEEKTMVTVVIGESLAGKVKAARISNKAKEMFRRAKQFHDGRWLFFEVKTESDIEDIEALLMIKRPIKK